MSSFDRRTFLGTSAGVAAGLAAHSVGRGEEPSPPAKLAPGEIPPPPKVTLGDTGVTLSRLGQGTGVFGSNRQSNQTRMGFEKLVSLFHHAYERGIRFYDLADLYGTHIYFREALRTIPRDEVGILTKIWWRYDGPQNKTLAEHREQITKTTVERFRHELATDYLDIVLLHCMQKANWPEEMARYMDELNEEKAKGRIKALGVSCHDFGALKTAAAEPWVDVILARINPKGVKMDATPEEIIEVLRGAKAAGKSVIGMKIFGEGQLTNQREECIRYAQQHDFMDAMTIGFEAPQQIDEVLQLMARYPMKQA
ncbi:aldo/keto reductase [Aeoliella mucimassa]|uniref:Putative oxidoreductase n=1 Tax=Aeoliella mucimassa TaxID=2527972 RepID=A0A518ALY3_9BACT|nr:aldo/keto reductase [Aeoliella mucimassa]QDU55727.1 putative oxidoreductase [Aeoliella mucimassa]